MKFGRKISADLYNEWRPYYLAYEALKRELKDRTEGREWDANDEAEFTSLLEKQLDKIHDFQRAKTSELSRRIREAEKDVKILVSEEDQYQGDEGHDREATDVDMEGQQRDSYGEDEGSDDDTDDDDSDSGSVSALENRFHNLEEEVANLVADVHDLALYTKLNITGFMKILKKHDKQPSIARNPAFALKATFVQDFLEKRPFYKYNWDALIVKLSKLYDLVRTRGHPVQGDSSAGGSQSAFVRQTTKYWVHPDNLVPLKLAVLRNLPVLVFNPEKEFEQRDAAITSIYFDNEDLELYLGRLEKTEGAEAIRLRWYGDTEVKTIFVERKTHREDWTGEKSVKARFPIKEHLVNAFLKGEYTVDAEFQQLVKKGKKTQQEVDQMIQLANEVQYAVLTRKLEPVVRTFYNRTAFQLPGDARVRISLDTELTMVREDNWDGATRAGDNWRRTDIGIDFPFDQVAKEDKELFKYGVLEVKLQTQLGQEPPKWVTDLVQSHLVEAVPKFSKFIHGCATLMPNRVDLIPFWQPQMETDILKPNNGYLTIERPQQASSRGTPDKQSGSSGQESPIEDYGEDGAKGYTEPISEGEEDEIMDVGPAKDEDKRTGLSGVDVAEAIAYRERMLKENRHELTSKSKSNAKAMPNEESDAEDDEEIDANERTAFLRGKTSKASIAASSQKLRAVSIDPLAPSSKFDEALRSRLRGASMKRGNDSDIEEEQESVNRSLEDLEEPQPGDDRELVRHFVAPHGKKISVPVRIEPKVYFACERTFLKWLNTSVIVSAIATTLLNFIQPDDTAGIVTAALFTFASLACIAYSAVVFVYRAHSLRTRSAHGLYFDKFGPTGLCVILLAALGTNLVMRWGDM